MNKIKEYRWIILIVILILEFSFYWFEWKPNRIKKNCAIQAENQSIQGFKPGFYIDLNELEEKNQRVKLNSELYINCIRKYGM